MSMLLKCCSFAMQVATNGLNDAELDVQNDYESYTFDPVNQAQILQLVIFIFMFFGATAFNLWFLKPLFRLLDRVGPKLISLLKCSCECCFAVECDNVRSMPCVIMPPLLVQACHTLVCCCKCRCLSAQCNGRLLT